MKYQSTSQLPWLISLRRRKLKCNLWKTPVCWILVILAPDIWCRTLDVLKGEEMVNAVPFSSHSLRAKRHWSLTTSFLLNSLWYGPSESWKVSFVSSFIWFLLFFILTVKRATRLDDGMCWAVERHGCGDIASDSGARVQADVRRVRSVSPTAQTAAHVSTSGMVHVVTNSVSCLIHVTNITDNVGSSVIQDSCWTRAHFNLSWHWNGPENWVSNYL